MPRPKGEPPTLFVQDERKFLDERMDCSVVTGEVAGISAKEDKTIRNKYRVNL